MSDRKKKIILPVAILAVGLISTFVMIKSRAPVPTRAPRDYAPLVRSFRVTPETHRFMIEAHGSVAPRTESVLVAEVAGQVLVATPTFASGSFFEKGDELIRVDPVDYELAVVQARGQVAQAEVTAELERAQAEVAREEWEDLGDGSNPKLATRELQVEQAEAALAAAEARGISPRVTSAFRSMEEQKELRDRFEKCVQSGRMGQAPDCLYPANRPGDSGHNFGLAFDSVVPADQQDAWNEIRSAHGFHVLPNDIIHAEVPSWRDHKSGNIHWTGRRSES